MRRVKFYPELPRPARLLLVILSLILLPESAQAQAAGGCTAPRFSAAATFTAGANPRALAVGDFNGDGKADAAVANQSSHNLSVFLGTGGGGFSAPVNYAVATQPYEIAAADFNGDGRLDLAVAGFTGQGVTLLLNDGAGNFTTSTVGTAGNTPAGLAAADFNNDGRVDLAAPETSSRIMVMLNAGGGTFNAPISNFVGPDAGKVVAADVNNDGKQDLVAADRGFSRRAVFVVLGNGAGGFGAPTIYSLNAIPNSLALGDVDADSDLDILAAADREVVLLRGDGAGNFGAASVVASGPSPRNGVVRDLDGDGRADLAYAFGGGSQGENGSVGVMLGTGGGDFAAPVHYHTGTGTYAVAASDFNSDAAPDLAVINYGNNTGTPGGLALLLNEGGGAFGASSFFSVGPGPNSVLAADFNGDGHPDLASPHQQPNSLGVIYGIGAGRFTPPTDFAFTGFPNSAATDDLNADGKADVIVTTQSPDAVYVFLGGGAAGLGAPTAFAAGSVPYGVAVGDYNGDGRKDLAVVNAGSRTVSILLGNGAGGFSAPTSVMFEGEAPSASPVGIAAGDFNGDGRHDLVVTPTGLPPGRVAVLLGAGDGAFTRAPNVTTQTSPDHAAVADFNKDGKQDLAIANRVSGSVSVAFGNGDGSFAAPTHYRTGGNPLHVSAADLNGDGALDLVVPTNSQLGVAVLPGAAAGTFGEPAYYPAGQRPQNAVVADLDGDGRSDIAANDLFSNFITVIRNACASAAAANTVQFGAAAYNAVEGAGGATISVNRSGDTDGAVTVTYATAGGSATAGADYTAASGTLTFGPGETVKTFTVSILEDTAVEGGETVILQLSDPGGATLGTPSTAELRIADNDSCSYGVSPASLPEFAAGGGQGTIQIVANVGCSWSSTSGENWIRPTAVWGGSGPGSITFNVLPNPGPARVGRITLTNGEQYEIRQAGGAPVVRFSHSGYRAAEGDARATVQIGRIGDTSSPLTVTVQTVDDPAPVRCDVFNGKAYARCDYATTVETVTWAAGDAQPKSVNVPLVDDGHNDGFETIEVKLTDPVGGFLLDQSTTTITVEDNDTVGAPNPISGNSFFVRMHYLDFLSREPEAGEPWTGVLDRCPDVNNTDPAAVSALCDRLLVSESFFRSPEFQLKGLYAYLFYRAAFDRRPTYEEIIPDMRSLAGATPQEVFARRAQYAAAITQRAEFARLYGALTNAQYVDALLGRHGLQRITTEDPADFEGAAQVTLTREQLVEALNNNSLSRAQVLRAVVQSNEVDAAEFHGAFVAMQYYGYLRRAPEQSGYDAWLRVIREDPNNVRIMVNGFMNSQEYRLRFGQP